MDARAMRDSVPKVFKPIACKSSLKVSKKKPQAQPQLPRVTPRERGILALTMPQPSSSSVSSASAAVCVVACLYAIVDCSALQEIVRLALNPHQRFMAVAQKVFEMGITVNNKHMVASIVEPDARVDPTKDDFRFKSCTDLVFFVKIHMTSERKGNAQMYVRSPEGWEMQRQLDFE